MSRILSSRIFPFVTAAVLLACYYLSLDIVAIYYVAISLALMMLVLDDLTPAIGLMPFINLVISYKNSPSSTAGESAYYFQPAILTQIIVLVAIAVGACIFRVIRLFVERKFRPTPVFFGLCAMAAAFLLNGMFSEGYSAMSFMYGAIMAALYLGIFLLIKDNIKIKDDTFERVALAFVAFSILLVVELVVSYFIYDGVIVDGKIQRGVLTYGWGVYNTMGMLLLLCIPSAAYLATRYKYGYLFTIYSFVLALACVFSMSRQALVGVFAILPLSLVYVICKSRNRITNICIIGGICLLGIVFIGVMWDKLYPFFVEVLNIVSNGKIKDSGRFNLYRMGYDDFMSAPAFGVGFFGSSLEGTSAYNAAGLGMIPLYYHNTLIQMAASCGLLGLITYFVHRIQTVYSYFRNPSIERSYVAVTILVLLLLSLIDVHMFSIFPNFVYSCFIALLVASEKQEDPLPQRQLFIIKV